MKAISGFPGDMASKIVSFKLRESEYVRLQHSKDVSKYNNNTSNLKKKIEQD